MPGKSQKEESDKGCHCLKSCLHLFHASPSSDAILNEFKGISASVSFVSVIKRFCCRRKNTI